MSAVWLPEGKDPQSGETARDKAAKFKHESIVSLLKSAEDKTPPGWYQTDGIGNNRKLYAKPELATQTPAKACRKPEKRGGKAGTKGTILAVGFAFPRARLTICEDVGWLSRTCQK